MDGIFIRDGRQHKRWGPERPTSKKEVKTLVETSPELVHIECTSFFEPNPYSGPVSQLKDGEYYFVGPNPHIARNFYGTLVVSGGVPKVK
jgi:hypothetical protein